MLVVFEGGSVNQEEERYRERKRRNQRKYAQTEKGRAAQPDNEATRRYSATQRANHPERVAARQAVSRATQRGDLIRSDTCEHCGVVGDPIEASHTDYTQQLDVEWLCRPCHRKKDRT